MTNRHHTRLGEDGEKLAERFLVGTGMTVVERRHRTRRGEIDLVCRDGEMLVFVEVKTTQSTGYPEQRIDRAKRRRLTRVARHYLQHHARIDRVCRFDVLAVSLGQGGASIEHFQAAFKALD